MDLVFYWLLRCFYLRNLLATDIKESISSGREVAYNIANTAMEFIYWHVDKQIMNACAHNLK